MRLIYFLIVLFFITSCSSLTENKRTISSYDQSRSLNLNGVSKVISAMPGAGKSTLMNQMIEAGYSVSDSDSQRFNFLTNAAGEYIDERGNVVTDKDSRVKNPNFVSDYVGHIKEALRSNHLVFVSAHEQVRDALFEKGIEFDLIRYEKSLKNEIVERILNRQSKQPNKIIANVVDTQWDSWMETIDKQGPKNTFVLGSGQFLGNILNFDLKTSSLYPNFDFLKENKTTSRVRRSVKRTKNNAKKLGIDIKKAIKRGKAK